MLRLIQNTLLLALAEIRVARRLLRFKALVAVLSVCLLGSYAVSCSIYFNVAPYAPSFVAATPLYLLENIDPIFYLAFMVSAFLLAFDIDHRHSRNRIEEVLQARPVSNLEWMAGRILGCAGLLWAVVAINVVAMQLVGLLAQIAGADFARSLQSHSVFVLLVVDAPAFLIAWCSLVVFLQSAFRNRILVAAAILVAAFASYVLLLYVPYWFVDLVSPSSNDTLFISDIAPQLPSASSILMRVGSLAGAAALIALSAWFYQRQDVVRNRKTIGCAFACITVGVASVSVASVHRLQQVDEVATWREAHQKLVWERTIDLQSMSGQVRIDPRTRLHLDLNLDFSTIPHSTAPKLTFSFNPGMTIEGIELNGATQSFSFRHGILEIPFANNVASEVDHTLRIVASGVPNPRFAYFDAPLDYPLKPGIPLQVTKSFGLDGSIYGREYVALMPGAHWYPTPAPVNGYFGDDRHGFDYFDLDLLVEVANPRWQLVGPGVSREVDGDSNRYKISPSTAVPEVGLFASNFETLTTRVDGLEVSLHLHARHGNNLRLPKKVRAEMMELLGERFQIHTEFGLSRVHDTIALVEVPRRLRTVGGGWRMDSLNALPGVVLVKESGYPTAPIHLAIRRAKPEEQILALRDFLSRGVGTYNLTYTLPSHAWSHATSASGTHAEILDQIVLSLLAMVYWEWTRGWFSPYSTMQFTGITTPNLWIATDVSGDRTAVYRHNLHTLESYYAARSSVYELIESTSLNQLPSERGHQKDLELVLLKSEEIAKSLMLYHDNDFDKIYAWLASLRQRFHGRTYTYEDLIDAANEHDIAVDPFLTDWLTTSLLPGFVISHGSVSVLEDRGDGEHRRMVSFSIRNSQPVSGFFVLQAPQSAPPILLEPNSARRVNLLWENKTTRPWAELNQGDRFGFYAFSSLSLNRGPLSVDATYSGGPPVPPRAMLENSTWTPARQGIVVDDLDDGFSVHQPRPIPRRLRPSSAATWFQPQVPEYEHDGQLAEINTRHTPASGRWVRISTRDAHGFHRNTVAIAKVARNGFVHPSRFSAQIPETRRWRLEFYVHNPSWAADFWSGGINLGEFKLRVENGAKSWHVAFDATTYDPGWRTVGEYDLSSGNVHVDVVGGLRGSRVYADAIRWMPIEQDRPLE